MVEQEHTVALMLMAIKQMIRTRNGRKSNQSNPKAKQLRLLNTTLVWIKAQSIRMLNS